MFMQATLNSVGHKKRERKRNEQQQNQENKKWDLWRKGSVKLDKNNGKWKMKYIIRA